MPRINIEDALWKDARLQLFIDLLRTRNPSIGLFEARRLAVGTLIDAWQVAQVYWVDEDNPESPIPDAIWRRNQFPDALFDAEFAERVDGGVYLKGSRGAFEWIFERREAGSAGGKKRSKNEQERKKSNNQVKQIQANSSKSKQTQANPTLYSSSSSSSSSSGDQIHKKEKKEEVPPAVAVVRRPKKQKPDEPSPTYEVWRSFADQYHEAWNVRPPSNAKNFRKCKELVDAVGLDDAKKIAAHYAKSCNEWYVKNGHDLVWMVKDYMRLHKEVNIGIKFTREVVKDLAAKENFDNHEVYGKHKMNICDDEQFEAYCQQLMEKEQNDVSKIDQRSARELA